MPIDLLLVNGQIWTGSELDPSTPNEVTSLAISRGKIVAIGDHDELDDLVTHSERVIDLQGRRVVPGLIDSHSHAVRAGLTWSISLHWDDIRSLTEGLEQIRAKVRQLSPGEWISVTGGWHSRQLAERRLPSRSELDEVAPENPVYIQELYNAAVLNSRALMACDWNDESSDPVGGELLRDSSGRLTGEILGMGAFAAPLALALRPTREETLEGSRQMMRDFASHGLTMIIDGGGLTMSPDKYAAMYQLWDEQQLNLRVRLFISAWTRGDERDNVARLTQLVHPGFGDGMLQVVGVGEIPHLSCHDMEGLHEFSITDGAFDEFVDITRICVAAGWRMSVHAILDGSLGRVLDAWELVEREGGGVSGRRFSIVHADQASERNVVRMADLGVGVMVQNRLMLKGTDYVEAWGSDAVRAAPPISLMKKYGLTIGGGTDATRANWYSPWASIGWLVTGATVDGAIGRDPENLFTVEEALASFNRDAAWFVGEENRRGRLALDYDADLCVTSLDPFSCETDELKGIRSDLTITGGRITHTSGIFSKA